jgi:ribosomal-protein-alanine N-acetyltransferase
MNPAPVSVRRMTRADLERVMGIAESLPEAPHWPYAAYLQALDSKSTPMRIALVAEDAAFTSSRSRQPENSEIGSHPFRKEREKDEAPSFLTNQIAPDRAIVGFAVASVIGPQAELEMIAVTAEAQRGGVARQLFADLIGELRKSHVEEVLLEVRASNCPARGFYRSRGFQEAGRRARYYSDPIEDALLMHFVVV